jgi:hypothetical protein
MSEICYSDRSTPVMLGDVVEKVIFFRRRQGRVVYVPGVSPLNKELDYDGLQSVGIKIDEGPFVATLVDPVGKFLQKKIRFIRRDASEIHKVQPNDRLFD